MSSEAAPITPARFRIAIHDLPISNLHAKAAELRNSITHLLSSNAQLQEFADAGDIDCQEAISDNEVVLARFRERIQMLREEVEGRGMRWVEDEMGEWEGKPAVNGDAGTGGMELEPGEDLVRTNGSGGPTGGEMNGEVRGAQGSGRLTDEELRRVVEGMMERHTGEDDDEEGGLHL
ncbi:hypothetical protein EJ08DRAFT_611252 [Tothia fuscella]|uniref:Uncharacterized protein n=1 Tax=Tothia fuscella TaxID=1048955 RepID=A0A9P4TYU0_9PEZI|nr:hypothetical protein EJ08DRAFT_611252 [Tothia fuscella]